MAGYNLLNAYGPEGQALFLEVPWEHEENELRILAATDVEDKFKLRLLGTDSYTRVGNLITVPYPFDEAGLPWRLFIWRVTDVNETVTFDGSRIPVEAIVAKLNELSEKVEEAQLLYRRAVKAPEDMDGHMILPTVAVRKGKVMGFDEHGIPLCGLEYIPETKEFLDQMKQMLEDMRKLFAELLADATTQITELRDASKAEIGELRDASIGEIEGLRDSSKTEISALRDSSKDEISKLRDDSTSEISDLRDSSKQELTDLRDASVSDIEGLRDSSKEEIISLFNTTKAEITVLLEDLKKDAEALKDSTMAELADLANKFVDGALADFKARAEEIADDVLQAKVDAAEAARVAAEAARDSASSYATKAMNANTGAWDAYSKSLDVLEATKTLKERCEEIYNVITQYRYVVLTREEYDALVEDNSIEEDVIYFVKGTQGLAEIRAELVEKIDELRADLQKLSATHSTDKAALDAKIAAVSDTLKTLSARVDALDPDLSTEVAELITTYDTAIAELREQCVANANGLTTVSSTVNGVITEVDEKLNSVETRLTESLSSIAEAKVQTAVDAEATARTEADTVLQGSVTRLSETSTDHETRIKANEAAIAEFVAGDAAWEQSLLEASTQVGTRLIQHEEKVAASNVLGHVYVGGNGIGISNGVLALNIRASYSGIQFANNAAYVNCAEQTLHPTAGTVAKVATDTAGALVVPDATDTTKGGVLIDKLNTDTGVLTNPVVVDGMLGERARVLHGEIQGDINAHGWKCTPEDLGAEAGATIVPTEISFYRRSADTNSDSTVPRYLRILRASADGTAWQIAYQSTNGLAPNSFTAGTAMTWKMRNVDGRGAIPAGETILLTQTDTPQSIATANVRWGAKNTTTAHGVIVVSSVIPSDPNGTVSTSTYSPAADMTYYKVAPLADALSAKADATDIAELQTALAELTARVSALENA